MDWNQLLSPSRLRRPELRLAGTRSPFQQDADLIVFSAAFRRLQDKTQVQPLSEAGRVRTRLTHSIEVAAVGRSLGAAVGSVLAERRQLDLTTCHGIASIVHAACLAHDIGNPPFGHGGEDAIKEWFGEHRALLAPLAPAEAGDLLGFDGNAQGFRTVTQLENYRFDGGLRLTHATLGAFMKYPVGALELSSPPTMDLARKKLGFFEAERPYAHELGQQLGLPAGVRHPLVYLTEAADDICYGIVDLEDGYDAGLLDYAEALDVLSELADARADPTLGRAEQLQKLRAIAIGRMTEAVSDAFLDLEPQLLRGEAGAELCSLTALGPALSRAKKLAAERLYAAPSVVERLLGGQRVLARLMEELAVVVEPLERVEFRRDALGGRARSVARLLGEQYRPGSRDQALLGITDFLSGLTDHAAVSLARRLSGEA